MTNIKTACQFLAAIALAAIAAGCASDLQEKENMAVAAGFKVITPSTPNQQNILAHLPPDKVTPVMYHGKQYYVLPDVKNNQAYAGGPAQYQTYRQMRLAKQISNEHLEAAQMNQDASMNWGAYGGWGNVYPMGGVGFRR